MLDSLILAADSALIVLFLLSGLWLFPLQQVSHKLGNDRFWRLRNNWVWAQAISDCTAWREDVTFHKLCMIVFKSATRTRKILLSEWKDALCSHVNNDNKSLPGEVADMATSLQGLCMDATKLLNSQVIMLCLVGFGVLIYLAGVTVWFFFPGLVEIVLIKALFILVFGIVILLLYLPSTGFVPNNVDAAKIPTMVVGDRSPIFSVIAEAEPRTCGLRILTGLWVLMLLSLGVQWYLGRRRRIRYDQRGGGAFRAGELMNDTEDRTGGQTYSFWALRARDE